MFILTKRQDSHPITTKKVSDGSKVMPTNQIIIQWELTHTQIGAHRIQIQS